MFNKILLKIKRRETPLFDFLYQFLKKLRGISIPSIRPIHLPMYHGLRWINTSVSLILQCFWYVPIFKSRCERAGNNLNLPNGIPYVTGSHLKIYIGDYVTIRRVTIGASKIFNEPTLKIGSNVTIGYGTTISVSKDIEIGDHSMISFNCLIMDSDDHPECPEERLKKQTVDASGVKKVTIKKNVWIGANSTILKGVTIGENSIIATHSVVTEDVPNDCVYGGIPAKLIKTL